MFKKIITRNCRPLIISYFVIIIFILTILTLSLRAHIFFATNGPTYTVQFNFKDTKYAYSINIEVSQYILFSSNYVEREEKISDQEF